MRLSTLLLLLASLAGLSACSRGVDLEIANNDSEALVAAIREANTTAGHNTIRLARNGLYILSLEAQAGLLLPSLRGDITIEGNHSEIRGYSAKPAAFVQVEDGSTVRLEHLVLAEGTDGTVRNYGQLQLDHVSIVDSSVAIAPAIVLNHGHMEAFDSDIAYNLLLGNRRDAGTVLNYGQIEFNQSRIHDNRAVGRYPTVAVSGGILNFGSIRANGLQLENNDLPDDVPGLSFGGILNLGNGLVTGNTSSGSVRDTRGAALIAGRL